MKPYDFIIKGGTIFDGTRKARFSGDLAIANGVIVRIDRDGKLDPNDAKDVIDASGLHVCPGFVDLHTHYDAQIQWDPYATLSGWHGVTSIVLGNCGFGFAPIAPAMRERAMLMMSRVEAIPIESMRAGMKWEWESFPQWLDFLDRAPLGVNVLSYVPLSPIMITVMGLDEAKHRDPTAAETTEMCRLLGEALDAGACGWSAQRLGKEQYSVQRDYDGTPMVTDTMSDDLCMAFAKVLGERGEGNIQLTQVNNYEFIEQLARTSGRPLIFNAIASNDFRPHSFRQLIHWIESCQANGSPVWGQAAVVGNDEYFMLSDYNLLDGNPEWRAITLGNVEERMAQMRKPENRAALREHYDRGRTPIVTGPISRFEINLVLSPENKKYEGKTIVEAGAMMGVHPIDAMLDIALADNLQTTFYHPPYNTNKGHAKEILDCEYAIPGVSDGGAHTKYITIGRYTTEFLAKSVREDGLVSLEEAHYRLSAMPARCAGFKDRGTLVEGAPADILVYDYANLKVTPQEIAHDFPAGEWRRVQRAEGYRYILVNGTLTFVDGQCTGATPGQLLRHGKGRAVGQERAA